MAKLHLTIANIRNDFLHKLSAKLVKDNQIICLEDLNVKRMVKNHKLSRAISRQGWDIFREMCKVSPVSVSPGNGCFRSK